MKKRPNGIVLLLIILFSVPGISVYDFYSTSAVSDDLSPDLSFEAFDQEDLWDADQSESEEFRSADFPGGFQPAADLAGFSSFLFFQISPLDGKTILLRC